MKQNFTASLATRRLNYACKIDTSKMNVSRRGQTPSTWKKPKKLTRHVWSQCNRTLKISRFYMWESHYFKTLSKLSNQPIRRKKKDY